MLNLQVRLFGVWNLAVVLHHARACGAGRRARTGDELVWDLAGGDQGSGGGCRQRLPCRRRVRRQLIQNPGCSVSTLANSRQSLTRNNYGPLRLGDEQEREVVTVVEEAEAGADDRLTVGRPGQTDARLDAVVVHIDLLGESGFEVVAHPIVYGQAGLDAPLILGVEAVVRVTQSLREISGLTGDIGVRPVGGNRRRSWQLAVDVRLHGAHRRAPENDGNPVQRLVVVIGTKWRADLSGKEGSR